MLRVLLTGLVCAVLTGILGRFLLPVLHALKAGQSVRDIGPTWHNGKAGTPLMGGLMFILGCVVCLLGNIPAMKNTAVFYTLGLALCFGLVGFVDDYFKVRFKRDLGLTALQKSLLQMAVSALYLYLLYKEGTLCNDNGSCNLFFPFINFTVEVHPMLYIFFAMFVMVGCVNAVNLTDGVDGLCATVTLPVMVFFAAVAVVKKQFDLALLPASMVGGLIAYLFYNWHPAKVFMGDTGSLFLGGLVCGLAFALDMPIILIFVGFIYVVETVSDILQISYYKITHGKRIFKMAPLHHHFEILGWKEVKIVAVFALVNAVMCLVAWLGIAKYIGA